MDNPIFLEQPNIFIGNQNEKSNLNRVILQTLLIVYRKLNVIF